MLLSSSITLNRAQMAAKVDPGYLIERQMAEAFADKAVRAHADAIEGRADIHGNIRYSLVLHVFTPEELAESREGVAASKR